MPSTKTFAGVAAAAAGVLRGFSEPVGRDVPPIRLRQAGPRRPPNPWLHEEVHQPTLAARLNHLIVTPDAYVVLRGGVGTLAEMALAWSLVQVAEVPARPIVLVGAMWREFVPHFQAHATINERDVRFLQIVDEARAVVTALAAWWRDPPNIPPRLGDAEMIPPLGN